MFCSHSVRVSGASPSIQSTFIPHSFNSVIGAINKSRKLMNVFFGMVLGHLLFGMASGILNLVLLYSKPPADQAGKCAAAALDPVTRGFCRQSPVGKGLVTTALILFWLFEMRTFPFLLHNPALRSSLVGLYITTCYSRQLLEEEVEQETNKLYADC